MKEQAIKNREILEDIKSRLFIGAISYDQAKAEAEPIIAEINKKAIELGKKYGMRPKLVSFQALMR